MALGSKQTKLYGDFWLSHDGDCAILKKTFSCQKCDYEINSSALSVRFKIKLIKGLTITFIVITTEKIF